MIVIGSVLTAAAVALGGLISFVGLIVPHMMRMLLGPDHTRLLPATALAGAVFLLVADTVARTSQSPRPNCRSGFSPPSSAARSFFIF